MSTRLILCTCDEIDEGSAIEVETAGLDLAVFNVDGTYYVTDNTCTHGPGKLSDGFLEGAVVECDFHGGQFDVRTGEAVGPPCMRPVTTYPTVVSGNKLIITIDS